MKQTETRKERLVWSPESQHAYMRRRIERACAGEDVIIARGTVPVVRLVPISTKPSRRKFGSMKGRARVTAAFFAPLSPEELDAWES